MRLDKQRDKQFDKQRDKKTDKYSDNKATNKRDIKRDIKHRDKKPNENSRNNNRYNNKYGNDRHSNIDDNEQDNKFDDNTDSMQIEGKNPVLEALKSGQHIDKILIADGVRQVEDIKQLASERGVKYQFVTRQKIDQLATTKVNQGIIAYIPSVKYTEFADWLETINTTENPIVLMLAELQDPHNVGSIIRTAEAAGVKAVIIAKHRAVGLTATVAKVSAGAIAHMPLIRVTNLVQTLQTLKDNGYWVVGTDAKATKNYYEIKYDMPTVLVIGSEGKGMGPLLEKQCDYLIKIPMLGKVTSLNASVAAGIMTYEIVKQRLN